jgi:hypothetical protein
MSLRFIPCVILSSLVLTSLVLISCMEDNVMPDCPAATAPGTSVWAYEVPTSSAYDAVFVLDPGGELYAAAGPEIGAMVEEHFQGALFWRQEAKPRIDALFELGLLDPLEGCPEVGADDFGGIAPRSLVASWATDDGCSGDVEVPGRLGERHLDWETVRQVALDGHPGLAADMAVKLIDAARAAQAPHYGFISAVVDGVEYEPVRCSTPEWRDDGPWRAGDVVCFLGGKPRGFSVNAEPRD